MTNSNSDGSCTLSSWLLAVLVAVLTVVISRIFAEVSWTGSIFLGVIALAFFGFLFNWLFCRPLAPIEELNAQAAPTAPKPAETPAPAPAAPVAAAPAPTAVEKAPEPAPKPAPAKKPAAKKASAEEAAPVAESEPTLMTAPKGGAGDDLKQIKGVGPKLEGTLNDLGIWHFDQIAAWTEAEIAWVDERLRFKGRIARDGWIDQAKTLAAGGTTEFSKKVKKGDVY